MIRRPPRSTLFPTRRSSDLGDRWPGAVNEHDLALVLKRAEIRRRRSRERKAHAFGSKQRLHAGAERRSEEHTSELQSRLHLVCRLLLEKKKKHTNSAHTSKS